jgi:Domain of unknown function (DUF4124)
METRPIFVALCLLAAAAAMAQQAYRWVDEDGIVHYSDRPEEGAEQIYLPKPNVTGTRRVHQSTASNAAASSQQPAAGPFRYESINITSPSAEETLWNIEGVLNISVSLTPALQPGHQVRAYFDGQPRMVGGTNFQIQDVYRGVHNIQVEVLDETGTLMIRSQPNRFYVQQNTVVR